MNTFFNEREQKIQEREDRREAKELAWLKSKATNPIKRWWYLNKDGTSWGTPRHAYLYRRHLRRNVKTAKKGVDIYRDYFRIGNKKHIDLFQIDKYSIKKLQRPRWWGCLPWDFDDIIEYLIVKLTIQGCESFSRFAMGLEHREQGHEIWRVRERLLKHYYDLEDCVWLDDPNYQACTTFEERQAYVHEHYEQPLIDTFTYIGERFRYWWD